MNVWQRLKELAGRAKPAPGIHRSVPRANGTRGKSAHAFLNERAGSRRDVYRFDADALKPILLSKMRQSGQVAEDSASQARAKQGA